MRTRITARLKPCTCGCQGQDPWHRAHYDREITLTSDTQGTIRLPMSTQPVVVKKWCGVWFVDRDSIIFDK